MLNFFENFDMSISFGIFLTLAYKELKFTQECRVDNHKNILVQNQ